MASNLKAAPDALTPDLVADFVRWLDRELPPRADDLGPITRGHVCAHGVRWPHACVPCDAAAWDLRLG
ncbi:hypothetical protein OVY48_10020 [Sphingobium sp. SA2]|uniref:hypothetical protein n=1 Tax=Sphingobium sp. SA2 TaxID=1524832 RepID=UPI0028BFE544|nr:hypothetical protein [Sphingobium sp. SA2]MDT7533760.1 hypothetical protein [Sphingobium sp. SA2]